MNTTMSKSTKKEFGNNNSNDEMNELRRGPWTLEEDSLLIHYIALHGEGRWNMLAKSAGLKRIGKSSRLRWLNYLKPDIKRGNLSPQEQLLILELHSKWGNRWSKIAQHLPGRTDNEIKNYWRTRVQKQARQLNIESGSKGSIDAVKCIWMPRLLQKMEQNNSSQTYDHSSMTNMNFRNSIEASTSHNTISTSFNNIDSMSPSSVPNVPNKISSLDFFQFSQPLETSENLKSAPNVVIENNVYSCPLQDNFYIDDTDYYGLEGLNFEPLSSVETCEFSQFDVQTSGNAWMLDNMANNLWNMDAM